MQVALHRQKGNHTDMIRLKHAKFAIGENPVVMNNVPHKERGYNIDK